MKSFQKLILTRITERGFVSVKDYDLVERFQKLSGGDVITIELRLSRLLARMYRKKILMRKKIRLDPSTHDKAVWCYAYEKT